MTPTALPLTSDSALVTGATGMQGGAVARQLARGGMAVTALVGDASSPPARALVREGIALAIDDLGRPPSAGGSATQSRPLAR